MGGKYEHNNRISVLEREVDYWREEYEKLAEEVAPSAIFNFDARIKKVANFIWRLKTDGLYTEELETFIEQYLKYHNA